MTIRNSDPLCAKSLSAQRQELIQLLARLMAKYWLKKKTTLTPVLPLNERKRSERK